MLLIQVEAKMEEVRRLLTNPGNLTVHMSVDVKKLAVDGYRPAEIWSTLVPQDWQVTQSQITQSRLVKLLLLFQ